MKRRYRRRTARSFCTVFGLWIAAGALFAATAQAQERPAATTDSTGLLQITSGWAVSASDWSAVDSFYVVVDGRFEAPHVMASGGQLRLSAGQHRITVATAGRSDQSFYATIEPGATARHRISHGVRTGGAGYFASSSYPALKSGATLAILTDAGAEVRINGRRVGRGPRVLLDTLAGTYAVTAVHPEAGTRTERVTVQTAPLRLAVAEVYVRPDRAAVRRTRFVPGVSQFYKNERLKSAALVGTFVAATGGAVWQHLSFARANNDYEALLRDYKRAGTEEEALRLGDQTQARYDTARRAYWVRNALVGVAVSAYVYGLLDSFRDPEGGYRPARPPDRVLTPLINGDGAGASFSLRF